MHIDICENPLRIKKDGHWRYVPCGKCNTCLKNKSDDIVNRLSQESRCWKYTVFFTLTYDNSSVPTLTYDPKDRMLVDLSEDEYFSLEDIKGFQPTSRLYLARRKDIPYLRKDHVQKFIKRLRFYVDCKLSNTNECSKKQIRYYIVGEYGPSTFRPHFHGLLFFSSDTVARCISSLIYKSWPFGRIDVQHSKGKSGEYCARYVNCVASLPKVYQHRSLRPFSLCSKFPSIGSLIVPEEKISQIFYSGFGKVSVIRSSDNSPVDVQLWRSLESKWFPKIARFNDLSHNERVTLYGLYSYCPVEGFETFIDWVRELIKSSSQVSTTIVLDYNDTSDNPDFVYKHDVVYPFMTSYLKTLYDLDSANHHWVSDYCRLKKLYYTSSLVVHQCKVFGCSVDFYVSRIEEYYNIKDLCKLKEFYEYQEQLAVEASPSACMFLYPDFVRSLKEYVRSVFLDSSKYFLYLDYYTALQSFGFEKKSDDILLDLVSFIQEGEFYRVQDTSRFSQLSAKVMNFHRKSKKRNDYINSVQSDYSFNLLKSYE